MLRRIFYALLTALYRRLEKVIQRYEQKTLGLDAISETKSIMVSETESDRGLPSGLTLDATVPATVNRYPLNENRRVDSEGLWQTLWAHLDSFLAAQNSPHTKRAYERDLEDFLCFIDKTRSAISVHALVAYRDELRIKNSPQTGQPLSHVSINRKIATIKSFLNWLVLNGVLPNNPARAVKAFRAGRDSPTRDIPDDRVRAMLEIPARHTVAGRMHHAMLMVLFHLGLRRSELVDLRTSDLFEREGIRVLRVRGKGDKERVLPLPEAVARSIEHYLAISRKDVSVDQPLFSPVKNNVTKTKEKNLHPNAVAYVVKHYAKLAGIHYRVSPHSARATAVSNALDHHAPHRSVQHMAGWSSPLMVTRYDKRKEELRNSAVRFVQYDNEEATTSLHKSDRSTSNLFEDKTQEL